MHPISQLKSCEKGAVLQEIRIFSAKPIKTQECYALLVRILYMCMHGEPMTKKEATNVFFGVTKLFQCKDVSLRRLVYIVLKALADYSEDVIIAIAALSKDLVTESNVLRANALRTIARVVDSSLLTQIERFVKQAILDKDYYLSSSALVSAIHLARLSPEVVNKWTWEIQEAMSFSSCMVQYHALILLCWLRRHDRVASMKMVQTFPSHRIYPFLGYCYMLRLCGQLLTEQINRQEVKNVSDSSLFGYMDMALRYGSDVVMLEGAKRISALPKLQFKEVRLALATLVGFLTNSKITVRFAAVRAIHQLAQQDPRFIDTTCCFELRGLINDTNPSTGLLAILILLQCEKEEEIPKVLRDVRYFMSTKNSIRTRMEIIEGIRQLSVRCPSQYASILFFLFKSLYSLADFDCKRRIVDIFIEMINRNPEISNSALAYLCEYIEDCEYRYLLVKILNLLGAKGPKLAKEKFEMFIRYIYNQMILDRPAEKVSALSALVKFETVDSSKIKSILSRTIQDADDAYISYRIFFILSVLSIKEQNQKQLNHLLTSTSSDIYAAIQPAFPTDQYSALQHIATSAEEYLQDKTRLSSGPFELPDVALAKASALNAGEEDVFRTCSRQTITKETVPVGHTLLFSKPIDQLVVLFPSHSLDPFKTSRPIHLTEPDVEYQVVCFKHIFNYGKTIILQFNILSTMADSASSNLSISLQFSVSKAPTPYQISASIPYDSILKASTHQCVHIADTYILLTASSSVDPPAQLFEECFCNTTLHLQSTTIDPHTSEMLEDTSFHDEYALDELTFSFLDYLKPSHPPSSHDQIWCFMESDKSTNTESMVTFIINHLHTLQEAVDYLIQMLDLQPCDDTHLVEPKSNRHVLKLFGLFVDDSTQIIVRAGMRSNSSQQEKTLQGVSVQLRVLANNAELPRALTSTILKW
ncbi:coatomer subunit gamma-2-like isoform X1 [Schistocerca gregaria]|uniref:coatomer subunit gamma-2-like isoform X1 n=1 Tax=Schistocerca gregaria TaxID=7010 RepID=UPI00211EDC3C|nr:coatomer subunit gamma-2-like isoform X1 [Schistocerca gregaria]